LKLKKRGNEFEFKLNQVQLPLIQCHYKIKNYRFHSTGYGDTRGVTKRVKDWKTKARNDGTWHAQ
jgi:hypothetical protein